MTATSLLLLALLYVAVLFAIASYSDRRGQSRTTSSAVYTLTLAVYCSSWTFFGAVGSMAADPWSHTPIYLGPVLVFVFAGSVVRRMIAVGHRQRVTSLADFLGARFGKRRTVAAVVSVICLFAVLPYISLQLRALELAWSVVSEQSVTTSQSAYTQNTNNVTLLAAAGLALFAILFGVRRLGGSERQHGLMHAMALESVVKLIAFVGVALLSIRYLASVGAADLRSLSDMTPSFGGDYFAHLLVSAIAILCLPRQFHVTVVELEKPQQARHIGWAVPLYLLAFMLLAVPIAMAGQYLFGPEAVSADTYVQRIPMRLNADWAVAAAFLGGLSAATSMVLVATVSVSIMITNEIITPVLFRLSLSRSRALMSLGTILRWSRQATVVLISMAAWYASSLMAAYSNLADIGFLSFLGAAQLGPALLLGLYSRRVHGVAVLIGMLVGTLLWLGLGLFPLLLGSDSGVLGFTGLTLLTLGANLALAIGLSRVMPLQPLDRRQAALFLDTPGDTTPLDDSPSPIRIAQLRNLVEPLLVGMTGERFWRVLETSYEQRLLPADRAPMFVVNAVESVLANTVGATSARQILERLESERQLGVADLTAMVGEAQRALSFNRESLEAAVEHLSHGVSVIDAELRLVAWNSEYEQMFDYPPRFLFVGCPIERVYRFNAERGILSISDRPLSEEISRRLTRMREGSPHQLERLMPDGRVLEIKGRPLPGGGFVTTYVDVTEHREIVTQLREAQNELKSRLVTGEQALSARNAELRREVRARSEAEIQARDAFRGKAHFMAATSHDLLQPINAARLLGEVVRQQVAAAGDVDPPLVEQLVASLDRAQSMIEELREIARLDAETPEVRSDALALGPLIAGLVADYTEMASAKGLVLRGASTQLAIHGDSGLLRRLLENLLSNAIKYTNTGRVVIGARPVGDRVRVFVADTGPGIPRDEQQRIFREFERLESSPEAITDGLGLGLSLVQRYAELMDGEVTLQSVPGTGSLFGVLMPRTVLPSDDSRTESVQPVASQQLVGNVLCIDNDRQLLSGLAALVTGFGLRPLSARSSEEAFMALRDTGARPDLIVADYRLDNGLTGLEAVLDLREQGFVAPVVVISADDEPEVHDAVRAAGHRFLPKPIEPMRLRALLAALLSENK